MSFDFSGLAASLPDALWPDSVTLEEADDEDTYGAVAALTDIDCRIMIAGRGNENESQTWAMMMGATHAIQLRGYYPTIATHMRARVGNRYFDIVQNGIRHSSKSITTLACSGTDATA